MNVPDKVLVAEQLLLTLTIVLSLHMSTLEPWHDPAFVDANPDDDRRVRLSNLANNSMGQEKLNKSVESMEGKYKPLSFEIKICRFQD